VVAAEMLAGEVPVGPGVATVEFVTGYGADIDPRPDDKTPEETGDDPLAPGGTVGTDVEFVSG
jgi:hypothetical protein